MNQAEWEEGFLKNLKDRYECKTASSLRFRIYLWRKITFWKVIIGAAYISKRVLDLVLTPVALILLSPVMIIAVLAIKIEDGGPIMFSQMRVGRYGKLFKFYKFRSMCVDAEKKKAELINENEMSGVTFKMKRDPRITKVGRIIRKLSIDELPQLLNVIKGDMSLVGPRPPVPKEVEEYTLFDRKRLDIIPGITCLWQISGRSNINFEGQIRLDVAYMDSQSFWGDIKILVKTIPAVLLGKGAC